MLARLSLPSPTAFFGLSGLSGQTQRGLAVAFSTSVAVIMGVNLVYPVLPPMMQQLDVDESAIGLVVTVYTVPMIFLAPVAGAVADLYGRRWLLFVGMLVFGLAGTAIGLAPSFEWVLVLRALQGVGASAITPLTIVLLSDLLEEGEPESSAQGTKVFLDRVGTALIPALAGVLAVLSWSLPFFLFALAIPVALLGLAWLPETRAETPPGLRAYLRGFKGIGGRPRLLLAFSAGFLRFFLDYAYFTYLPVYLALTYGASSAATGLLFSCFAVGAMVTASQAGRLARGRDPAHLVFVGFVLAGGSVLLVPFVPPLLAGLSLFIYGLGNGLISPLQKSLLTRNAPPDIRGGVISLDRLIQQVAKSVAPGAMGILLLTADVSAVFWTLGALSLGSVPLAALLLGATSRSPQPAAS